MMTVSIVAVLTDPSTAHACLEAAATAAAAIPASEIEAFHPRIKPESMIMPTEEVMTEKRRAELVNMLAGRSIHGTRANLPGMGSDQSTRAIRRVERGRSRYGRGECGGARQAG